MTKGTGLLFISIIVGLGLSFITRVIVAHYYEQYEYGLFNLYLVILNLFGSFVVIGLTASITRFIAYYNGKNSNQKIPSIIGWGFLIGIIETVIISIVLVLLAQDISKVFTEHDIFSDYIKLIAITMPFFVILHILTSIYRGYERVKERIIFYDILKNLFIFTTALIVGFFSFSLFGLLTGILMSYISVTLLFVFYWLIRFKNMFDMESYLKFDNIIGKKLLLFSIPLLFSGFIQKILNWADTLLLGLLSTEKAVGLYNSAKPICLFINIGLTIVIFVFSPLSAKLFAKKEYKQIDILYSNLTKWICFLTLPLSLMFIFYSESIIHYSFGREYIGASYVLKILSFGYFINTFLGPNGPTLTSFGKPKIIMIAASVGLIVNLILNIILIPKYGIFGVAIATSTSFIVMNFIKSFRLYQLNKIHPFRGFIIKPIIITILIAFIYKIFFSMILDTNLIFLFISFIIFEIIFLLSMVLSKSVTEYDLEIMLLFENKTGISLKALRKLLKRYL